MLIPKKIYIYICAYEILQFCYSVKCTLQSGGGRMNEVVTVAYKTGNDGSWRNVRMENINSFNS